MSLRNERGAALATSGSDGTLLARALGIAADPLTHAAGAGGAAVAVERQMRTALWPVTWGYLLDQLAGELSDDAIATARAHFLDERGRRRRAADRCGSAASRTACWRSRRSGSGGCSIPPTSTRRCRRCCSRSRPPGARR